MSYKNDIIVSCYNSKGLCVFQTVLTAKSSEDGLTSLIAKIKDVIGEHRHGYRDIPIQEVLSALDIHMISWT